MNTEFTIKNSEYTFRIKEMNAIEVLAIKHCMSFENTEKVERLFNTILEKIEVKIELGDTVKWSAVKEKGRNVFCPAALKDDLLAVNDLMNYFLADYLKPLFQKSVESKHQQA